ncbi:MAG TPA: class I SAM-dependent methyltransferase [Gemmatimonadales bacterium]|nr:class I SAM-dependent methyltransferase [Gemmatimonadales bacterium]
MSRRTLPLDDRLYEYLLSVSLREPEVLRRLREETAAHPQANMQIGPEQGQFMGLLARLIGARKCLEVGVFTGYSALAVALALPFDGRLVACDLSEEFTAIGRPYWREAGVEQLIRLELGPALETLDALLAGGEGGTFDFAFIDADKTNYAGYYERTLELLRPGGLVAVDNVLWGGKVADPAIHDADVDAIRALNEQLLGDERIDLSLLPIGDGLTLARKR